ISDAGRCRRARRHRKDDQAAPRIDRPVRKSRAYRSGRLRKIRDRRAFGLPAAATRHGRDRAGRCRSDCRIRRFRCQGHGQGHGAVEGPARRARRHGEGLRPGQGQARLKNRDVPLFSGENGVRPRFPLIPESFKQDLLIRVDIVDVVSRYVQLKKAGANHLGLCPFHNEKTPSFTVSAAKQFYHCFGCGAHGNAIGFLMSHSGLGYIDAIKELAASVGMQVPEWQPRTPEQAAQRDRETDLYALLERAMDFYRAELKKSPRAIEYLKGRGASGEIAARFRVGYAPDDWQGLRAAFPQYDDKALVECGLVIENEGKRYDRFRDRVMFPIFSARGAPIGFGGRILDDGEPKYLNSPETPLFEKGREVYGLVQAREAIRASGRVVVVEGYMDVISLAQFGVAYGVATLGTATTPVHVSRLLRLADEIVFCFDGDAAGRKAARRALDTSLPLATDGKTIRFLFLPEGEDPDTFIRKQGRDAFERLIPNAQTLSGFLLGELRSAAEFASAEGRSRFLTEAKPHLQRIAAPGLKLQLIKEVADLAKVSQDEAERLLDMRSTSFSRSRPGPGRSTAPAATNLEWT